MTFTPDSKLVSRVVPSPSGEVWSRGGTPIRGIAIHMAQGGGTEYHLDNLDGNSSHYVVKYSGELVQMVPEYKAAGSMNPKLLRTTDDSPFTNYEGLRVRYGITALKASLGMFYANANAAAIAIEIEGFAGDNTGTVADRDGGPNDAQERTLVALINDIRRRRGPLPCFGHRDQQSYKACPGSRIPWKALGGHGVVSAAQEVDVPGLRILDPQPLVGTATIKNDGKEHAAIQIDDQKPFYLPAGTSKAVSAVGRLATPWPEHPDGRVLLIGDEWAVFLWEDVNFVATPDATPYSKAQLDAAVATAVAAAEAERQALTTENSRLHGLISGALNMLTGA